MDNFDKIKRIVFRDTKLEPIDWCIDSVIALGAFGFALLQLTLAMNIFIPDDFTRRLLGLRVSNPSFEAVLFSLLTCLPLICRRRTPWIAFSASVLVWVIAESILNIPSFSLIAAFVGLFTIAYTSPKKQTIVATIILIVLVYIFSAFESNYGLSLLFLFQNLSITTAVSFAGYALHSQRKLADEQRLKAQESARLLLAEQQIAKESLARIESESQTRIEQDRLNIARDVHDITAHSLTAINVQASAALSLLDNDPESAKEALENIKETTTTSISEIRQLLNFLRNSNSEQNVPKTKHDVKVSDGSAFDENAGPSSANVKNMEEEGQATEVVNAKESEQIDKSEAFARADNKIVAESPAHTISDILTLKKYLATFGIECEIVIDDDAKCALPAFIQSTLYEIVREATTNVAKHSDADHVTINCTLIDNQIELDVFDNGSTGHAGIFEADKWGCGLTGISERVQTLGGSMRVYSAESKGFHLDISITMPDNDSNDK